ncbi:MAG TPA: hypothetical protein VMS30_04250 [Phycisphaerales bacterium]|nr:hypothetical protein [Phycisphaerales bacterium]
MPTVFRYRPGRPPTRSVGMQLMFDFTRSVIFDPVRIEVGVPNHPEDPFVKISVDAEYPWLVSAGWQLGEPRLQEFEEPTLTMEFVGEPLQPIGHVWTSLDDMRQLRNAIDPNKEITEWIKCRTTGAKNDPAKKMFLEIDKASLPNLMPGLKAAARAKRQQQLNAVMPELQRRLGLRKRSAGLIPPTHMKSDMEAASMLVRRAIEKSFKIKGGPSKKKPVKIDLAATQSAFDRFAAGLLRQQCAVSHVDLQNRTRLACDADSAFVFMFAELALTLIDLGSKEAKFWKPLLNSLVRMQRIYVLRHNPDPACFKDYGKVPPPVMSLADMNIIVAQYENLSEQSLMNKVREHATHVHTAAACFGP